MKHSTKEILENAKTIAIIGCSENEYRTSHHIAQYLQDSGYRIIPVNPNYDTILGEKVYESLNDIPEDPSVDVVDIFRNSEHTAAMVDDIISYAQHADQKPVVWTQLDVSSPEAEEKAQKAGLSYIKNECIMVQHQQLL